MIRTLTALTALAALVACKGDTDDVQESVAPDCDIEVKETFPADQSTTAYYRGEIEFHLTDPDTTATLTVDGVTGTQSTNEEGDVIFFTPDSPLEPLTSYTASLDYCAGNPSVTFTTSSLGQPVDPSILVNQTYDLDLQAGRIVVPEGVGSVLESYLEVTIFMSVLSADATAIAMFGALEGDTAGEQDYCTETLDFPEADFSASPYFAIGPQTTVIAVAGYEVEIADLFISGTFAGDGSYWGGGVLSGLVDTRPLVDLIEEGGEEDAVCELVKGFGVECIPCPSTGEEFCLEIKAVDLGGDLQSTAIQEIEQSDCHELCTENSDDCVL